MKTKQHLLAFLISLAICCLTPEILEAQTAYAVNSTSIITFDLSSPESTTTIASLPTEYYITGGTWVTGTWYVGDFTNLELGTIDVSSGNYTSVGSTGIYIFDLAYDNTTGTMYALGSGDFSDFGLYTIDLISAEATLVGNIGAYWPYGFPAGLACSPAGNLYITDADISLYQIDKSNASHTYIGSLGVGLSDMPNLEYDQNNNILYLSGSTDGGSSGELRTVDPATGNSTLVNNFPGGFAYVYGLAITEGAGGSVNDIAIQSLISPVSGYGLSATEQITIRVVNEGSATQSDIPVSYSINGSPPVNEIIAGPVSSGSQMDYTFSQTANLTNVQSYTIVATASLVNDEATFNNSVTQIVTNQGYSHDLAALSVNGPSSPFAGIPADYSVFVKNTGGASESGASYTVTIYDEYNAVIGFSTGADIAPGEVKSYNFALAFNTPGPTHIYARVFLTGDLNSANDQSVNLIINVQEQSQSNADVWTSTGPDGVNFVNCIGGDEAFVFAGTDDGLYKSDNAGLSWTKNLANNRIYAVTRFNASLFAGTSSGVYRSNDNGVTWIHKSSGLPLSNCKSFAVIGNDIFVGLNSSNSGNSGVYRSSDNGENWIITSAAIADVLANNLLALGNTLFIGSVFTGIWRSTDQGANWSPANTGMGNDDNIYSMTARGNTIFAGTDSHIYRSVDNGTNWTMVADGYTTGLGADATHVYAGIFSGINNGMMVSTDDGLTWNPSNSGLSSLSTTALFVSESKVFSSHIGGISRSTDNGSNWIDVNNGIRCLSMNTMLRNENRVYASAGAGIYSQYYFSTNDGGSWAPFKISNQQVLNIRPLNSTTWAAMAANVDGSDAHFYLTYNGGAAWISTASDLTSESVYHSIGALGNTLFASILQPDYTTVQSRSTDNGLTWIPIPSLNNISVGKWKSVGTIAFAAGTANQGYLYRSADNGLTWSIPAGLTTKRVPDCDFITIGAELYLGIIDSWSGAGIYKSTDNGAGWTVVNGSMGVTKFFLSGNDLYINNSTSIYHSADNGITWTDIGGGLSNANLNSLNVHNFKLFIGSNNNGVFCSTNKGLVWFAINNGFNETNLPDIYRNLIIGNEYLIAGTNDAFNNTGQSVWRRRLSSFTQPAQPSAINGSATPCVGASYTYSVTNVPGVTYNWQVPSNWTINAGNGTNSISVTVGSFPGLILVIPSNEFGSGPAQFLIVSPTTSGPAQPGAISGPVNPLEGSSQNYNVTNDPGVSYAWTFPAGWVQTGGGTTNAVTVTVGSGSGNITVTPSTLCGNGPPRNLAVSPVLLAKTLNLSVFLEGLYDGANRMREANNETGPQFGEGIADEITVELHNATTYGTIEQSFSGVELDTYGNVSVSVPNEFSNSYYITIKHRNSIETVSAAPISFAGSSTTYAFNAPEKAYGGNLLQMLDGTYVIYGGDVTQDGTVDSGDMTPVDNDAINFMVGYLATDVNGDGTVDSGDMTIVDNNSTGFISAVTP